VYNTILVPLDGSKRAEAILPHVEELAQRYDATVVFLQVVVPVPMSVMPGDAYLPLEKQFNRRTEEVESYLFGQEGVFREKGLKTKARVVHGPVVEEIINAAEQEEADLIAIASHGRSGLSQVFYGSVAAGVLHRVDRPLLIIRSRGSA
jgi:nucleotide-binding universal stress UspA family protein